jgi:glycosyltransferase involved in cell wall biosynthesis/O-antigen/teichoic acid export membrane protein
MAERKHVLFVGVLPPPLHGQSRINEGLVAALRQRADLRVLDTSPRRLERTSLYYGHKIARVLWCLAALAATARPRMPCYLSLSSRLGLWLDLCFVLIARVRGCRLVLHHHTYNYIDERSRVMSILAAAAGANATHIFACEVMRDQFGSLYRNAHRTLICSLAMFGDLASEPRRRSVDRERAFKIGMLSNLTAEKGLRDVLAVVAEAGRRRLPVSGVLAGPVPTKADRDAIGEALGQGDGRLSYRGPVYGAAKDAFFDEIDAFLLPTRSESYGLVIIEALSRGVPVIASARGCIGSYLTAPAGYAIPPSAAFPEAALESIVAWISEPDTYGRASEAALRLGRELRLRSEKDFSELVSSIIEDEDASVREAGPTRPHGRLAGTAVHDLSARIIQVVHARVPHISVKRIAGTFAAEIYGQAVALVVPLVQLPILLLGWGEKIYGEWLVFSAITLYLTTADLGYTYSAKNSMTIRAAAGDREGALRVYQSVLVLLACIAAATLALAAGLLAILPVNELLQIHETRPGDVRPIILLLVSGMLLHHFLMLQAAAVRCVGRPALEIAWFATSRLLDVVAVCAVAVAGGGLMTAAIASVATWVLSSLALALWLRRFAPWLRFGLKHASLAEIRALFHPSIGYMLLPLSHTLLTQGPVLVLANYGSSSLVVLYSASRTLARLGMAGMNAVNSSFIAEYSYSLGRPSAQAFKSIGRYHASAMAAAVMGYVAVMWVLAVPMLSIVTAGRVEPEPALLIVLAAGVALEMIWSPGVAALTVLGRHMGAAYAFAALSVASVLLSIPATARWGVTGPAWTALIVHAALVLFVAVRLSRLRSVAPRWTALGPGHT